MTKTTTPAIDEAATKGIEVSASSNLVETDKTAKPAAITTLSLTDGAAAAAAAATAVLNERLSSSTGIILRLFGRDREQGEIVSIYNRFTGRAASASTAFAGLPNKTELILVRGAPGTGKSALSKKCLSPLVVNDGGYYITGKFDQLIQLQTPHSAFVEALTTFAEMILERGESGAVRAAVTAHTEASEGVDVLLKNVPALAGVLGVERDGRERVDGALATESSRTFDVAEEPIRMFASSRDATSRFRYAVQAFFGAIATKDRPLVLVMEDLHWADEAALDLLLSLLGDASSNAILFVATYRDDADSQTVETMLKKLQPREVSVTHFHLSNLGIESTADMLADILQIDLVVAKPIADLVYSRTNGNPYFVRLFLRKLVFGGFLRYDNDARPRWILDVDAARVEFADTMAELVRAKICRLPDEVLRTLRYASCLSSKLDEDILSHLVGEPPSTISSHLIQAAECNVICRRPGRHGGWAFAHDAMQDATSCLIPEDEVEQFHYRIGRRLWRCFGLAELDEKIFVVVDQLLAGSKYITADRERVAVAKLCLRAGERSVYISSFQSALKYVLRGIDFLGTNGWRNCYHLTLDLYNAAAELGQCTGNFDDVHAFAGHVLRHATCFDDTLRSHAARVYAFGSTDRIDEAIVYGLQILSRLGEKFPANPTKYQAVAAVLRVRRRLKRKTSESLLRLPLMVDGRKLAALELLNQLYIYALMHQQNLSPLIGCRMVSLTLEYGLNATSCIGFVTLGALLCGPVNDIDEGYRLGQVGLSIYQKFRIKVWLPRVTLPYYVGVHSFKHPLSTIVEPLRLAHRVGIEYGDTELALLCGGVAALSQMESRPLSETEASVQLLREKMTCYTQTTAFNITKPALQAIHNLMGVGQGSGTTSFFGAIMDEKSFHSLQKTNGKLQAAVHFHIAMFAYLFGNDEQMTNSMAALQRSVVRSFGAFDAAIVVLFDGLVATRTARVAEKRRNCRRARRQVRRMRQWAQHAPHTFLCRQFLLEAEIAAVTGDSVTVYPKYVAAISLAKDSAFTFLVALGNELAGKYYLFDKNDEVAAWPFLQEALRYYEIWGATAKVDHLALEIKRATGHHE